MKREYHVRKRRKECNTLKNIRNKIKTENASYSGSSSEKDRSKSFLKK